MKKIFAVVLLVLLVGQVEAQRRYAKSLQFNYPNGKTNLVAGNSDTVRTSLADTVSIGLMDGDLFPSAVTIIVQPNDADVSATPDSLQAIYYVGSDIYNAVSVTATAINESPALASFTRTFVFNNTGASTANNTQATLAPIGSRLRVVLKQASNDGDSISYSIRALAVYDAPGYGRTIARSIPFTYRNGGAYTSATGDTLFGATADTVNVPMIWEGLYPKQLSVFVKTADADVSGTPDSVSAIYYSAIDSRQAAIVSTTATLEQGALGVFVRTFVPNTTGGNMAHNTQASLVPYGDKLRMVLKNSSVSPAASADTTSYKIRIIGIYEK